MSSYKEHSKTNWTPRENPNVYPGDEKVTIGCLQRIADATEKMTSNYTQMENDLKLYKRWYEENKAECERMSHRIRSYQGVITKLKKKIARGNAR